MKAARILNKGRLQAPTGTIRRWGRREGGGEYLVIKKPDGSWGRYEEHPQRAALASSLEDRKKEEERKKELEADKKKVISQIKDIKNNIRDFRTMHSFLPRYGSLRDFQEDEELGDEGEDESGPLLDVVPVSADDEDDMELIRRAWFLVTDPQGSSLSGKRVLAVALLGGRVVGALFGGVLAHVFSTDIVVSRRLTEQGIRQKLLHFALAEFGKMKEAYGDSLRVSVDGHTAGLRKTIDRFGFERGMEMENGRVFLYPKKESEE